MQLEQKMCWHAGITSGSMKGELGMEGMEVLVIWAAVTVTGLGDGEARLTGRLGSQGWCWEFQRSRMVGCVVDSLPTFSSLSPRPKTEPRRLGGLGSRCLAAPHPAIRSSITCSARITPNPWLTPSICACLRDCPGPS